MLHACIIVVDVLFVLMMQWKLCLFVCDNAARSQWTRHLIHLSAVSDKGILVGFFVWLKGSTSSLACTVCHAADRSRSTGSVLVSSAWKDIVHKVIVHISSPVDVFFWCCGLEWDSRSRVNRCEVHPMWVTTQAKHTLWDMIEPKKNVKILS